jgi:hypothetical protein
MIEKMLRNQKLRKLALKRDMGICACCGLSASEVHHIQSLALGGEDELNNLISLCHPCHHFCPNTRIEFIEYQKEGGAAMSIFFGKAILKMIEAGASPNQALIEARNFYNILKVTSWNWSKEKYSLKESLEMMNDAEMPRP